MKSTRYFPILLLNAAPLLAALALGLVAVLIQLPTVRSLTHMAELLT
jgi:hypothetical protein